MILEYKALGAVIAALPLPRPHDREAPSWLYHVSGLVWALAESEPGPLEKLVLPREKLLAQKQLWRAYLVEHGMCAESTTNSQLQPLTKSVSRFKRAHRNSASTARQGLDLHLAIDS